MTRAMKLAVGTLFFAQAVLAQPGGSPSTTPPPGGTPAGTPPPGGSSPPGVDVPVRQRATLSQQEMVNQSRGYVERTRQAETRIKDLVETARKQKDVIRLNCLSDKLVQVKANLNIAEKAHQALQEAGLRRDEGASLHEFTRVTIVNQKVQVLADEAAGCAGEDLRYIGETRVDVEVVGVPDGDFEGVPRVRWILVRVSRPSHASSVK